MLTAENFKEMWRALESDEERQIADARIRIRESGRAAREALQILWRRFHEEIPLPIESKASLTDRENSSVGEDGSDVSEGSPLAISLSEGIRRAIGSFELDTSFTTGDLIDFLMQNYPELHAENRRVHVSSYISKMVAAPEPKIEIVQKGEQGMPHTYRRRRTSFRRGN